MNSQLPFDDLKEIISFNPATGEEIGHAQNSSTARVRDAVGRSREIFKKWKTTSFDERAAIVMKAREVILAEMDDIAKLISDEVGKPFAEALSTEIVPALDLMQYFAKNAKKLLKPERIGIGLTALMGRSSTLVHHPLGVIGIISPWNYPFTIPLGEVTMALMAGNTVVLKPSELTPLIGLKIGEVFKKAGLPDDVLQIMTGDGSAGAALVEVGPDKIMFTGSVTTGKRVAEACAKNLIPYVLELGGKDPMIVLEDANLELAADAAVWGAFCNSGQTCASVERLYVHESIAEEFISMVVDRTKRLRQGLGSDDSTDIGSMISEDQLAIVEDHVKSFELEGAKILTGGRRNPAFTGIFFEPTVITGVSNKMRGMREETFGPTLPIATFSSEEEAIRLANDSDFGLTASVWTADTARGERIAEQIEAATVTVNEVLYTHGIAQTPWAGFKSSGVGRTHGASGLKELVATQHIHVNNFPFIPNVWWLPYSPKAVAMFKALAKYFASGSILKSALIIPSFISRVLEMRKKSDK